MNDLERIKLKAWIANWRKLGPELETLRTEEHRRASVYEELISLSDITESALRSYPPKPTSGIIEMQRLFAKLRDNETGT